MHFFVLQTKSSHVMYLFHPFQNEVWLLCFGVFFVTTLCYLFLEKAVMWITSNGVNSERSTPMQTPTDRAVWYCIQIWLFQCKLSHSRGRVASDWSTNSLYWLSMRVLFNISQTFLSEVLLKIFSHRQPL